MLTFTDQLNETISLENYPKRIISLVPSQTELLFDLGLAENIVGITKFCIHPKEQIKNISLNNPHIKKIGGTKNFNFEQIKALSPDLIIGNKEENYQNGILELKQHFPVFMTDIYDLNDALQMIKSVGNITNTTEKATNICNEISKEFAIFTENFSEKSTEKNQKSNLKTKKKVAYFIWNKPMMIATTNTFIDNMLQLIGFENAFSDFVRYPAVSEEDVVSANPDVIFLSSEPFPFKEKHISYFKNICPHAHVQVVDGELFSWYGSRLKYAAKYFKEIVQSINTF